ncbi:MULTISPECIES: hypothetical protein [unclassified Bradyrhizobium]|uniref:hypothetical protein n=1 Tax=unclassified Bradyrhizobium TaxID=2631580 RepID=UPI0024798287|nr:MULTISPECIES: hypothetical protein [unclassified Bradyrhizobium]WGR74224.1 hypothetical protein MTX24_15955 [Bradyrhizobium sp. ISRA426]WGR79059.1 hypothetical protein MTX21_01070 [Bradyrhizobium sp. ISRA430]WGR89463.1 hypothetical protein MTX25_15970 [Bradyrhizobium sp. ISRA432]
MMNVYIEILLFQLPLYGLIIGAAYGSWLAINRRQYLFALFLAAIAVLPFGSYLYSFVEARFVAPIARKAEVESWQRMRITRDNKPRTFITTLGNSGGSIAKTLVGLGRFEKAYGLIGDDWYSFERIPGSVCAEPHYDALSLHRQDEARESTACVSATKLGRRFAATPQIAEPHLRLLTDAAAPSHHQSGGKVYAGDTLELRLVSEEGDQLVSFWEAAHFDVPAFPPILVNGEKGWIKKSFAADHAPRPEPTKFVLDALGDV